MGHHPLAQFTYCPICGSRPFNEKDPKAKRCAACGFVYYFNPSAAVACFIRNPAGELLVVRRGKEPAADTLDLPGGFVDMHETAEEAAQREILEETGLVINSCRYLFSLPNIYRYSGFDVHTVDLFFECFVDSFTGAFAGDDASGIVILRPKDLCPAEFGLTSIRQGVALYVAE